jgi:hypothetical protein
MYDKTLVPSGGCVMRDIVIYNYMSNVFFW